MNGISTVAKIEKGRTFDQGAMSSDGLVRATGGNTVCPGSGADCKTSWKGEWRFRSTDPWTRVVNRNQLHIEYTSPGAAIAAARYTRNTALKLQS